MSIRCSAVRTGVQHIGLGSDWRFRRSLVTRQLADQIEDGPARFGIRDTSKSPVQLQPLTRVQKIEDIPISGTLGHASGRRGCLRLADRGVIVEKLYRNAQHLSQVEQ